MFFKTQTTLSVFRERQLKAQLKSVDSRLVDIIISEVILADLTSDIIDTVGLEKLLDATVSKPEGVLVVPRIGTISPWSSKATDIVKNSAISGVKRVELAHSWRFLDANGDLFIPNDKALSIVCDRMTHEVFVSALDYARVFSEANPTQLNEIDVKQFGAQAIIDADSKLGLVLGGEEVEYLTKHYTSLDRNPTDAELMMFAQANSEHCRHKIFNATWTIDGEKQDRSLFKMIKNTYEQSGDNVLSAY